MSLAATSIVMELLTMNPSKRLGANGSFEAFRQHCFFEGIDDNQRWGKILKDENIPYKIDPNLFQGLSFINYGLKHC
jgi:hypothetical protein